MAASLSGHHEIVHQLLMAGATPDLRGKVCYLGSIIPEVDRPTFIRMGREHVRNINSEV